MNLPMNLRRGCNLSGGSDVMKVTTVIERPEAQIKGDIYNERTNTNS